MNKHHPISKKNPKGAGRNPTPEGRQLKKARRMVNLPPIFIPELDHAVERQGIPESELMRTAVMKYVREINSAA